MENQEIKKWYVYIHINKINNKKYIGISSEINPNKRWKNGYGYRQQMFFKAIQKYGWDNFEHKILFNNLTEKEAKIKEKELIAKYKTNNSLYGYNKTEGGDDIPEKTPELLAKISNSLKEYYKTEKGVKRKEEISKKQKDYYRTHEPSFKGKHHTDETKKLMSKKAKERKPNRSISIKMLDDNKNVIKIFNSKQEALIFLNVVCYSPLNRALEKHIKYKNYYWEYVK